MLRNKYIFKIPSKTSKIFFPVLSLLDVMRRQPCALSAERSATLDVNKQFSNFSILCSKFYDVTLHFLKIGSYVL